MSSKLHLNIISQEAHLDTQDVEMVLAPSLEGQIGILPGHISLFTVLGGGELILVNGSKSEVFAITGGFLDVNQDKVTVLADSAIRAKDIDVQRVQEAMERAKQDMRQQLSEREMKLAEADLRRAILELKVAKKRRHHQAPLQ